MKHLRSSGEVGQVYRGILGYEERASASRDSLV